MCAAAVVWDSALLAYDLGGDHPFNPIRLDLTIRLARELGVLDGVDVLVPEQAPDAELERVHGAGYLEAVKRAPESGPDLAHGLGTADNPVFDDMHSSAALVVGSSLLAARQIASGRTERAVNIAGGLHHAMADRAGGFCIYNDVALAVAHARDAGHRVLYVDLDVHHGDGTQALFWDDPQVLTFSIHQTGLTLFPGTGFIEEHGGRQARGTAVNVPLQPYSGDASWQAAVNGMLPALAEAFRPTFLVSQHGCDSHALDPLAHLRLTTRSYRFATQQLDELAPRPTDGRWLATGGGG
jgi:acetoin utilization protein AcuC